MGNLMVVCNLRYKPATYEQEIWLLKSNVLGRWCTTIAVYLPDQLPSDLAFHSEKQAHK